MMTGPETRWLIAPTDPAAEPLARRLGLLPITAQVLVNRGIRDEAAARRMLRPDLNDLVDPFAHPEMQAAAERLALAVERGERVVVYGDYDVDGISATAILMRCLKLLGVDAHFYIPDRIEEGYGLNAAAIRGLAAEGTGLLVTVDCGISAAAEVALARELGMDVVVTDHHEPGERVPAGAILVNPKLAGCAYAYRDLSGAGLSFKLAWALGKRMAGGERVAPAFRDFLMDAVSLAALGTIADVVPLQGENRVLAHYGLRALTTSALPGIVALRKAASVTGDVGAFDVGFKMAPRINAAGRLGSAVQAVELLTTDDPARAEQIVAHLNRENTRRQKLQEQILLEAREMVDGEGGVEGRHAIVLAREGWHAGVIGIVASRLAESYCRPTILLSIDGGYGQGSARSFGSLHLFDTLQRCAARLTGFGGHARAAGLRLLQSEIAPFREEFERAASECLRAEDLAPEVAVDAEVRLSDVTRPLLDQLETLAPFGEGNREPLLSATGIRLPSGVNRMGQAGRHLSFWVNQDGVAFRAVAFGREDWADRLHGCSSCRIAFVPRLNRWQGNTRLELDVRDVKVE